MSKIFGLLVGVDEYKTNGSRTHSDGKSISLDNLRGCINDVQDIQRSLRAVYGMSKLRLLTSPATLATSAPISEKTGEREASYQNIRKQIDRIYNESTTGDLFYFHFSGHGARLKRIHASPPGREEDPSMLLADYCCGQPALRGWQLNQWLKRFYEKGVQVVVTLDSCYSGEAWRGEEVRCPTDWTMPPPNLAADEVADNGFAVESDHEVTRNFRMEESWEINPEGFTLMTACAEHQTAAEALVDGRVRGFFTNAFVSCLRQTTSGSMTYRILHDKVKTLVKGQTPQIYGQDRLELFRSREPVLPVPLLIRVSRPDILLPIGQIHGVVVGTEFRPYPAISGTAIAVYRVGEAQSWAKLEPHLASDLSDGDEVYFSRWGFKRPLNILVQASLGTSFRELLKESLEDQVSSAIDIVPIDDLALEEEHSSMYLRSNGQHGIAIKGPQSLTAYADFMPFLENRGESVEARVQKMAFSLVHLFRFQQILDLGAQASRETFPLDFSIVLEQLQASELHSGARVENNTKLRMRFANLTMTPLFVTILNLGPGFHVRQLYPVSGTSYEMMPKQNKHLKFRAHAPACLGSGYHRDIVRIIVTRDKALSMRTIEMPDIWDTRKMYQKWDDRHERHATMRGSLRWWIKDVEIWTRSPDSKLSQTQDG